MNPSEFVFSSEGDMVVIRDKQGQEFFRGMIVQWSMDVNNNHLPMHKIGLMEPVGFIQQTEKTLELKLLSVSLPETTINNMTGKDVSDEDCIMESEEQVDSEGDILASLKVAKEMAEKLLVNKERNSSEMMTKATV